jgi:hypothetical protein
MTFPSLPALLALKQAASRDFFRLSLKFILELFFLFESDVSFVPFVGHGFSVFLRGSIPFVLVNFLAVRFKEKRALRRNLKNSWIYWIPE